MAAKKETGVWVLTVEPHWGTRGTRKEITYFFRNKPTEEVVKKNAGANHYSLMRHQCGHPFSITTYH